MKLRAKWKQQLRTVLTVTEQSIEMLKTLHEEIEEEIEDLPDDSEGERADNLFAVREEIENTIQGLISATEIWAREELS